MTFERWLIVVLTAGLIVNVWISQILAHLRKSDTDERQRCERNEDRRQFFAGWNAAVRTIESGRIPKEAKAGEV